MTLSVSRVEFDNFFQLVEEQHINSQRLFAYNPFKALCTWRGCKRTLVAGHRQLMFWNWKENSYRNTSWLKRCEIMESKSSSDSCAALSVSLILSILRRTERRRGVVVLASSTTKPITAIDPPVIFSCWSRNVQTQTHQQFYERNEPPLERIHHRFCAHLEYENGIVPGYKSYYQIRACHFQCGWPQ